MAKEAERNYLFQTFTGGTKPELEDLWLRPSEVKEKALEMAYTNHGSVYVYRAEGYVDQQFVWKGKQ